MNDALYDELGPEVTPDNGAGGAFVGFLVAGLGLAVLFIA